jgi:hypothetical protein
VIHGQAFVQYGDVRVIGEDKRFTEFNINLRSRENTRTEHKWAMTHELRDDGPDTWERRHRKLRDETLHESPGVNVVLPRTPSCSTAATARPSKRSTSGNRRSMTLTQPLLQLLPTLSDQGADSAPAGDDEKTRH